MDKSLKRSPEECKIIDDLNIKETVRKILVEKTRDPVEQQEDGPVLELHDSVLEAISSAIAESIREEIRRILKEVKVVDLLPLDGLKNIIEKCLLNKIKWKDGKPFDERNNEPETENEAESVDLAEEREEKNVSTNNFENIENRLALLEQQYKALAIKMVKQESAKRQLYLDLVGKAMWEMFVEAHKSNKHLVVAPLFREKDPEFVKIVAEMNEHLKNLFGSVNETTKLKKFAETNKCRVPNAFDKPEIQFNSLFVENWTKPKRLPMYSFVDETMKRRRRKKKQRSDNVPEPISQQIIFEEYRQCRNNLLRFKDSVETLKLNRNCCFKR